MSWYQIIGQLEFYYCRIFQFPTISTLRAFAVSESAIVWTPSCVSIFLCVSIRFTAFSLSIAFRAFNDTMNGFQTSSSVYWSHLYQCAIPYDQFPFIAVFPDRVKHNSEWFLACLQWFQEYFIFPMALQLFSTICPKFNDPFKLIINV